MCEGQLVLAVNGMYTSMLSQGSLLSLLSPSDKQPPPLILLISRPGSSEYATLTPTDKGLGFHIKGNSPVIIHAIDKGTINDPFCCTSFFRSTYAIIINLKLDFCESTFN